MMWDAYWTAMAVMGQLAAIGFAVVVAMIVVVHIDDRRARRRRPAVRGWVDRVAPLEPADELAELRARRRAAS